MPPDYQTLEALRQHHPAWRLLCSDHAALIGSFLGRVFIGPNRRFIPQAESLLMDQQTLLAHRHFWGTEPRPSTRSLTRLNPTEARLYSDLQHNTYAQNLRLEQERVPYSYLIDVLKRL